MNTHPEAGRQLTADEQWSDSHVSELFADQIRDTHYHAEGLGWMRWNGKIWQRVSRDEIIERSRTFALELQRQTTETGDPYQINMCARRLKASSVRAVVDLAKGQLLADAADFDARPDLLNVGNGVVNLRTGKLRPHDPKYMFTKITAVNYMPDAIHSDWGTALSALTEEVADWMQVRFGQAITGHSTPDDLLPVCQGGGANGKSTVVSAILRAAGDHAVAVHDRVLMGNPNDHPTELMVLRGARLAIVEETPEGGHLNVKRLKDTLGTDRMTARYISANPVSWECTHSLFLTTNHPPRITETDHGTWRRLALVRFPFTYRKPGEPLSGDMDRHGDPRLRDRLKTGQAQQEAVLAWLIEGARRWYEADQVLPPTPASVVDDTKVWRGKSDQILSYFAERLAADAGAYVISSELHADFVAWQTAAAVRLVWDSKTFSGKFAECDEVQRHGITYKQFRPAGKPLRASRPGGGCDTEAVKVRGWIGVRFQPEEDDEEKAETAVTCTVPSVPPVDGDFSTTRTSEPPYGSGTSGTDLLEGHWADHLADQENAA
ncbi:phage/plasmid primase, P4 family [Nocardia sp. NPDC051570]|uniref:DNA primase family protein n=1 Tax=Nocardia sp. NPDC051570 TaxID=3364324 RepID=UPI00378EEA8D